MFLAIIITVNYVKNQFKIVQTDIFRGCNGLLARGSCNGFTTTFYHCGIDYTSPLILREGKRRNARNTKYVSIFVCFATKAVHIELVSDLTSHALEHSSDLRRVGASQRVCTRTMGLFL